MKTRKLFVLIALASIIVFASCKKEDSTPDPLTKTEAEAAFTQAESDYNTVTEGLNNIEALEIQSNFDNFFYAENSAHHNNSIEKEIFPSKVKDFDYIPYVELNINNLHGTYTYSTGWVQTSTTPTDKLILIMPYGDGGTATLTYSNYETKTIGDITYTSRLKAELKLSIATTPIMTWEYTQLRSTNGNSYKFAFTIGEYTKISTYSFAGTGVTKPVSNSTKKSRSVEWYKNGDVIFAKSFDYSYTSDGQQGYTVSINSKYRVKSIVIKWAIDYDETTYSNDINDIVKTTVWTTDGAKIGDIIFKVPVTKVQLVPYIVFNNGDEVPLSNYLTIFEDEIYYFTMYLRDFDK